MRQRLIRSTLTIVVVAVVMLGGPLLVLARHQVWSSANQRLHQQTTTLASELEDQLSAGDAVDLSSATRQFPGERLTVVRQDGRREVAGAALQGAVRHQTVGVSGATVTIAEPAGPTVSKAWEATLLVIGLALLAAVAAVALAVRQARRLAAPLDGLAAHAYELGSGEFAPSTRVSGIPEIDAVSRVLDRSAAQIGALVALQREFASDAAHQLRTPLTGIGLRLEEISQIGDPEAAQEADAALGQVERLNRVITTLLARARGDSEDAARIDMASLLHGEAEIWSGVLQQEDRELVLETVPGAVVYARREHVIGILTSLLDNALAHGRGDVTIRLTRQREEVSLSVRDEGSGVPAELRSTIFNRSVSGHEGSGIGLALARSLALGEGGTLKLSTESAAELVLLLPAVRDGEPVTGARRGPRAPHLPPS